jgi:hypothetical protein
MKRSLRYSQPPEQPRLWRRVVQNSPRPDLRCSCVLTSATVHRLTRVLPQLEVEKAFFR